MPAKLKISIEQRKKGLDLLAKGHTVEQAANKLQQRHHPEHSVQLVKRVYFPRGGIFAAAHLEGKSKSEIAKAYVGMAKRQVQYSRQMKQRVRDPEFLRKQIAGTKAWFQDPEKRAAFSALRSELMRRRYEDPGEREKQRQRIAKAISSRWSDAASAVQSERMKAKWRDPEYRKRQGAIGARGLAEVMRDPAQAAARAERGRAVLERLWKDPEFRVRKSEIARRVMKAQRFDPSFMAKQSRAASLTLQRLWLTNPAFVEKQKRLSRARLINQWRNIAFRAKITALNRRRSREMRKARVTAEQPGGYGEIGTLVPVVVPEMEESIDDVRKLRRGLMAIPLRQRFLVAKFLGIELPDMAQAEKAARQQLHSWEVEPELKGALATLAKLPVWKKILK